MTPDIKKNLIAKAEAACQKSYAPYSKFHVGAAVLTEAGNIYEGCNVENVSYGLTVCAERNAVFQAVAAEGKNMQIKAVAVFTPDNENECTPGGACRQVIAEFSNKGAAIFHRAENGWNESSIGIMLPHSFQIA